MISLFNIQRTDKGYLNNTESVLLIEFEDGNGVECFIDSQFLIWWWELKYWNIDTIIGY